MRISDWSSDVCSSDLIATPVVSPAMQFAAATAVTPRGDGLYDAAVAPGWDIGGNANGGYLLSIAGRAMADAAGRPDPVTITAHYLSPGKPGPLIGETEAVKAGKRVSTVRGTVRRERKGGGEGKRGLVRVDHGG